MNPFSAEHEKIAQLRREAAIYTALEPLRQRDQARAMAALVTLCSIARAWIFGVTERINRAEV
jgi:hypothetical protein